MTEKYYEIMDRNHFLWGNKIPKSRILRWIDNFTGSVHIEAEEKKIASNLLKHFIYYTENEIDIDRKIIFYFEEIINPSRAIEISEEEFDVAFQLKSSDVKIKVELYNEVQGLLKFRNYLEENIEYFRDKMIIIDISVFIKPYFYLLLKHLTTFLIHTVSIIYTEPSDYSTFTSGTSKTVEIPSFSGIPNQTKRNALIILLGFEGTRTAEVLTDVDPQLTIPINGFPSYIPEFKDASILFNKPLLSEEEIFLNLKYAPAFDPFETSQVLTEIYSEYNTDFNITIAPLGTKPMALGACLFALEHPACRIVYPYPLAYLPKSSLGWGGTHFYFIMFTYE